jgi:hypothetical protein
LPQLLVYGEAGVRAAGLAMAFELFESNGSVGPVNA